MSETPDFKVLALLSGGIDSTACIEYYLSRNYDVSGLFIDYGQPDSEKEMISSKAVSDHYSIPLKQITVKGTNFSEGYIPGRNAMLLSIALLTFNHKRGIIALGIHAGTPYADCSPVFEELMQRIYVLYEEGRIRVDAPFLHWTKSEIWDYAKMQNVPLHLTHSTNIDNPDLFGQLS